MNCVVTQWAQAGQAARAAGLEPDRARYLYVYAVALLSAGRSDEAMTVLEEALAKHPDDREMLSALIGFNRDAGKIERALEYAERLDRIGPNDRNLAALIQDLRRQAKTPSNRVQAPKQRSAVATKCAALTPLTPVRLGFSWTTLPLLTSAGGKLRTAVSARTLLLTSKCPAFASAAPNTLGQTIVSTCPIYEGYPDCHPDGLVWPNHAGSGLRHHRQRSRHGHAPTKDSSAVRKPRPHIGQRPGCAERRAADENGATALPAVS